MAWEPISFYPLRALDSASYYGQSLVFEGLVKYDARMQVVPALASSFDVSADGLTYRFSLRPDLKFSTGEPLTAEDVVSSICWAAAPSSPYHADYADIASAESTNGGEVIIRLQRPSAPLLSRLIELRIIPRRFLEQPDGGREALSRQPVGAGPFRLASWESGAELVFERNEHYWGNKPKNKTLVWRVIPDKTLLALALRNGDVDVAHLEARAWASTCDAGARGDLKLARFPGSRTIYLGFNLEHVPFDLVPVRRAIGMGIDRQGILDHLYMGYGSLAVTDFATSGWAYNPNLEQLPYDPEEARRQLRAAGFVRSAGAWMLPGAKNQFAFPILTVRDYADVAEYVSFCLKGLGIPTEVRTVEFATLRQRYLKRGEFDAVVWSRSVGPDPESLLSWHSGGALNFYGYSNTGMDRLLEIGRRAPDQKQRIPAYRGIQEILAAELPWVFLIHPDLLVGHSADIRNVRLPGQEQTGLPWDNPLFNAPSWVRVAKP